MLKLPEFSRKQMFESHQAELTRAWLWLVLRGRTPIIVVVFVVVVYWHICAAGTDKRGLPRWTKVFPINLSRTNGFMIRTSLVG